MRYGLLVSMAVGDSYGAGFEFRPPEFVDKHNDLTRYLPHQLSKGDHKPGMYTDDTQMSLALAEFMLSGQPLTTLNLADFFVDTFKRDPRTGYAGGFYDLLMEIEDGEAMLRRLQPHSSKCGGAMRAPVLGLLNDNIQCADRAAWQASLTHATPRGMAAASAAALLTWLCRNNHTMAGNLRLQMRQLVPGFLPNSFKTPVSTDGIHVVNAAARAVEEQGSMSSILKQCVDYGGDTDTVAAIALAAASQSDRIEQDLPDHLIEGLENGPYGFDFLTDLDARLEKQFDPQPSEDVDDEDDDGLDDDILSFFNDPVDENPEGA